LVVRHRGTGAKPPLLLTAHLDVVEADPSKWQRPPFSGDEHDGCLGVGPFQLGEGRRQLRCAAQIDHEDGRRPAGRLCQGGEIGSRDGRWPQSSRRQHALEIAIARAEKDGRLNG